MGDKTNPAVSDVEYNIITTMSNLLQAQDVLEKYAQDAKQAGNDNLASIFEELSRSNHDFATRLRDQLHGLMH
ncbi:MAG TPA: hypothetical protein VKZ61_17815 [Thermomicrobiales bacterium]|jgi:hypothetical protein|nr:hypothetical protein [Thermomicrobiales bacterium]